MKAVVFDFDGTLTKKNQNIWKMLWEFCGYPTDKNSLYAKLYVDHVIKKQITRQEWFDRTCEAFKQKNLTMDEIFEVSKQIDLINGFQKTILTLYQNGYDLFIVSGCLSDTIEIALGEYIKFFKHIETNRCAYDMKCNLKKLIPTDYDYEGKAKFIEEMKQAGYKDITFVGNADNDEWVYQTGCKTICVNPDNADENNKQKWQNVFKDMNDLSLILNCFDLNTNCDIIKQENKEIL